MGSPATSIPPLAPPPPIGAGIARPGRSLRPPRTPSLRVVARVPEPTPAPPPAALAAPRPRPSGARPALVAAAPAPAAAVTFVIFRADGGAAKTLRLSLGKLAVAAVVLTCALAGALSLGWTIGEWTARL